MRTSEGDSADVAAQEDVCINITLALSDLSY
jgi:hypothetical protein